MTPEEIQAALAAAQKLFLHADWLADGYSGNNPGKQRRLDENALRARREVTRLLALVRDCFTGESRKPPPSYTPVVFTLSTTPEV
jgi:hypothetical protein